MIQNDIAILKRVSLSKLSKYISKKLTEIRIEYTKTSFGCLAEYRFPSHPSQQIAYHRDYHYTIHESLS